LVAIIQSPPVINRLKPPERKRVSVYLLGSVTARPD
jgi:hypothetical protein